MREKIQHDDVWVQRVYLIDRMLAIAGFTDNLDESHRLVWSAPAQRSKQRLQALPDARLIIGDEQAYKG